MRFLNYNINMNNEKIYNLNFTKVYQLLVEKIARKGKSATEIDDVITWLTGYTNKDIEAILFKNLTYKEFLDNAPLINEKYLLIKGSVCKVKIEDIQDRTVRLVRCIDKMVDDIYKGKSLDSILNK